MRLAPMWLARSFCHWTNCSNLMPSGRPSHSLLSPRRSPRRVALRVGGSGTLVRVNVSQHPLQVLEVLVQEVAPMDDTSNILDVTWQASSISQEMYALGGGQCGSKASAATLAHPMPSKQLRRIQGCWPVFLSGGSTLRLFGSGTTPVSGVAPCCPQPVWLLGPPR